MVVYSVQRWLSYSLSGLCARGDGTAQQEEFTRGKGVFADNVGSWLGDELSQLCVCVCVWCVVFLCGACVCVCV